MTDSAYAKIVAVTGATGFIGHVLVRKLVQNGWIVRALTRSNRSSNIESLQWIQGDLNNLTALHHLIDDAAFVIHCAATVRGSSFQEFADINIKGTGNLLCAITQKKQSPRFLLISSLAARQPDLSWYAQSKYLSEQVLIENSESLQWTIFRPTAVYGPGDKEIKPLFRAMSRGLFPIVGKVSNRFGLIHVYDLVAAIEAWLSAKQNIQGVFELDDGTPGGYSYQGLTELAQQVWKRPVHCIAIPDPLIRSIASANLWLARLFRYSPMLTPGKVNELQHPDWVCDNAPLIHELPGWHPSIRLQDVLSEVI
ncbi:MAG: NAD-dependent epimerase/dehydratase family protein [Betaproteobacteria bacterium]|nr:NAD-dependent epimerase/dehydratase family protein [Betaproteobacteria bacterium]